MIKTDFSSIQLKLDNSQDKARVYDPIRKKWIILNPEEHVRQYILHYLLVYMRYPQSLIAVERSIKVGKLNKRFDIVIYDKNHKPWMLVECKAPEVAVSEKTLHQLLSYQQTIQGRYWLLTNGHQTLCADATDEQHIKWLQSLPAYEL